MRKKRNLPLIALALVVLLIFQMYSPMAYGDPVREVYDVLENKDIVVSQDGVELTTSDDIDAKKNIKIEYSFDIPVIGDDPTPAEYVIGGDYATFDLPLELTLVNSASQNLEYDGDVIGQVDFAGGQAVVTFSTLVDDLGISGASAGFEADMTYDASGVPEDGGSYTITILGKTFTVVVPPKEVTISGQKEGTVDITNKIVDWKVTVTADLEGGGEGKLMDYSFSDDLSGVGVYVPNSFEVGKNSDGSDAVSFDPGYEAVNKTLSYNFPDDGKGTYYLFFQTEIDDSMFYSTTTQNITNTATISKGGEVKATPADTVSFQMEWIKKNGVVAIGTEENPDGSYNSTARKINWTIQANQMGATIDNAVITDTLPDGLSFESATIAYRNIGDADFGASAPIVPGEAGQQLTFNLGNDLSGKECLITLVTEVDDTNPASGITVFNNSATLTGDNLPGGGFGSNIKSVNIGFNPISKSAGTYNTSTHKMNWSVTVNTRKQLYSDHLRVLDLLVYGANFNAADFNTLDVGLGNYQVTYAELQKLTPRFNQKYDGNFTTADGLEVTVHHLEKDGKNVADILVVTQSGGIGFDHTKSNSFSYDTLVTNPDIYASNATTTIYNTATLFSSNLMLNSATASKSVASNMLRKDLMTRENALAFENNTGNIAAVNSGASGASGAFRYDDKSVIYRIHVNSYGLTDATNDVTTVDGEKLGNIEMTDTLPKGWEFKPIDGKDFLIFEKTVSPLQAIAPEIVDYSTFLSTSGITAATATEGESMSFEFSQLTKPYVILVKAGPTTETAAGYFSENKSYNLVNNVAMANTHYSSSKIPKGSVTATVTSELLEKAYSIPESGTLLWTVDYKPYDIIHDGAYIEDVLPAGLDLRMDAQGNLVLTDNIKIVKLILAANGSYSVGDEVPLPADQTIISYNNATRTLRFDLPDTEQAYRLTYKTDITGNPGATMTNSVSLCATHAANEGTSKSYSISNTDATATFTRGGWIRIAKINQASAPLAGAEFTLFAADGTTAIKKGVSGADGIVQLKAIVPGNYILQETGVPAGYNVPTQTYTVSVVNNAGTINTSINDTGLNTITVRNTLIGTAGDLKISKTVTGNAGDVTKEFTFTVTFTGTGATEFPYTKTNSLGGTIKSGDSFKLSHGQEITIIGLPKNETYTVTENNYAPEGYNTVTAGDTGIIVADATQTASFINSKKKKDSGGVVPVTNNGSVEIIKVDGDNTSKTLSGAVFQLLDNNESIIATSEETGSDGEVTFDKLNFGVQYFIREKTAPEGYKLSNKKYSFQLTNESGQRNITIEVENQKLEEEKPKPEDPVTPVTPETPEVPKVPEVPKDPENPITTGIGDGDVPRGSATGDSEDYLNIDSDGIPTSGLYLYDPVTGERILDVTPKTGVGFAAKKAAIAVAIFSGCGLILIGIMKRKKYKV